MPIHPTAIVDPAAEIDATASIGPYAVIEGHVCVGAGCRIYPHAYLSGWTELGANCQVHPSAVVGHLPQDLKFDGSRSWCRIGAGTIIREGASIHRGTEPDSETVVGRNCFIMAAAHVGHNCVVGDEVKLANAVLLAGHVTVGNAAFISGGVVVHQFCRIGEYAMVAGGSRITMDAPPFFMFLHDSECVGVNLVGLRRAGFSREEIAEIREAYRILYRTGRAFCAAIDDLAAVVQTAPGRRLAAFLQAPTKRGFCNPPGRRGD